MAFWGVEVKPGKPVTHSREKARGRLRISQATLGISDATKKSLVQCNVGNRCPVLLCALLPNNTESCHLDLEFEEADDVVFSVIGPRSVYLTGYYVARSQQSNTHSDTESFGVDIENSRTEGSSYDSTDDKYDDSFIDDGELQVSPPSPVSSGKDKAMLDNDRMNDIKDGQGKRKKKFQVIETDSDDDDGYLLSIFKTENYLKTTTSDDGKKSTQVAVQMGGQSDGGTCGSESQGKADSLDAEPERPSKASPPPFHHKETKPDNEKPEIVKDVEPREDILCKKGMLLTDGNGIREKAEVKPIDPNVPTSNGSTDAPKAKKKRKERSKEEITCEIEAPTNLMEMKVIDSATFPKLGSKNGQKLKKRKKEVQLEGTRGEEIGAKCHNIPKDDECELGLLTGGSMSNELLEANGKHQEQKNDKLVGIITNSELPASDQKTDNKISKKKQKKSKGNGDLDVFVHKKTDTNTTMKCNHQIAQASIQRTLSNGLIVEEVANGPSDGKVAAPGKKVKIYYTAMLKESGHIFDSNVGKTACKFLLGDKEVVGGWNLGIDGMRVGDKRRITIPPSMGYGKHGAGENVPPNSWLVYEVELVSVRR